MTLTVPTQVELLAQPADDYMNEAQQQFFRALLLGQRSELQLRIDDEFAQLREPDSSSDVADIGAAEEQRQWQLRLLNGKRSCWTRSTRRSNAWPVANTAGAPKPASPSA